MSKSVLDVQGCRALTLALARLSRSYTLLLFGANHFGISRRIYPRGN